MCQFSNRKISFGFLSDLLEFNQVMSDLDSLTNVSRRRNKIRLTDSYSLFLLAFAPPSFMLSSFSLLFASVAIFRLERESAGEPNLLVSVKLIINNE